MSFEIVDISELAPQQVLDVINAAFGRNESLGWFQWKHREGPWGPSIGVAAVDQAGPIGVRLLLPWRLTDGNQSIRAHRATEAATVPRAQGRGVFTALNRWMMEDVETDLIFSTPNLNSRGGYVKLGWREIGRIPHRWELATRPLRNCSIPSLPDATPCTAWDETALGWRADPRSGHRYSRVTAAGAELRYRVIRRAGTRVAAPLATIGDSAVAPELWRRMLIESRAHVTVRPASQPAPVSARTPGLHRGESLLLGWHPENGGLLSREPNLLNRVPWSAADLEGVI